MTKHEIIQYIAGKLEDIHKRFPVPTDYGKRREAYATLRKEAAAHGYTGATYSQLYDAATKIHARRMGIKDTNGKP